ncbi:MAG: hypothetical protein FJ303_05000, partial [Planctomycetes bacterium]|nr:hypothetical protein [Planctomycetota bacterium]
QPLALATVAVTSGPGTGAAAIERTQAGSGRPTDVYTVTFSGAAFAGQAVSAITASTSTAGASVAVSKVADGGITAIVSPGAALYLDSDPTHNNSSLSTPATQTLILNGAGPNNAGALRNVSGNNTWQGPITLQSSSTFAADATTQLTVSGVVRDPSPAPVPPASVIPPDVTKIGQGTLAFSNANTYTGNTFINNGIVNIQNANALGEANSTQQTVDVSGSGGTFTLSFTGFPWLSTPALPTNVNAASLAFELNNILTNTLIPALGGGNGRVSVNLLSNGSTFVVTFTNALKGKNVPLLVAPQATQLGGASVSTGMLLPGGASKTIVATGATLQIQNTNENAGKPLVLNGAGFNNLGALHNLAGNNTWNDLPITLGSDTAFGASAGTLDITQPIVDTNSSGVNQNFKVTKVGGGTVEFSGKTGTLASVVGQGLGGNITSVVGAAGVVTVTTSVAHTLVSGNLVTINGTSTGLDGNTYFVTVVNATQYRLVGVGTTLNSSTGTWSYPVIVTTTAADNSLRTGESVMVNAVAGFAAANGTFPIIAIAPNQFALAGTSVAGTATPNTGVWSIGNNYTGLTDVHQGTLQLNVTNPVNPAVASPSLAVLRDLQVGDATPVGQVHTLDLSTFNYGNQFTLAYNSSPASAPITYYTNPTFAAALIQTTLNGLSTIGGLATPGSLTVTPQGGGIFAITFGGSLAGAIAFTPITAHNNTTSADRNSTQSSPGAAFALNSAIAQLLQSNQIATTSAVTVNSDGLFDINAQVQRIAQLSVNRGTTTTNAAATGAGTLNVIGTNGISLTGGATLTTQGTGSQVNVTGPLTANASNVLTPGVNSQVNVTGTMTATSSTLGDSGTGTGSQINVIGTLTSNASTFTESAGASQINVTGTFNANANTVVTLAGANTQVNVTGPLNETDATFTASGASSRITVDGVLNMTGGTINLQHATSQLVLGANGSVTATSNAGGPATVSGAGAFALNGNDRTFTVNDGTNTTDLLVGAKITGTGTEKLVKTGPGRLELGAVNTYTGLTQIVNGDVQVDGGAQIAGVEFNGANPNEASLSGNGTVGAVTMASGAKGTVSPGINTAGNHTGSLTTTSDVTWNNNAKFSVDLAYNTGTSTPSNDVLHVTGNLTLNDARLTGTATLGIPLNQPYTIANYTGTLTGFFTGSLGQIAQGGAVFISGQKFQVDYGTRSNSAIVLTRVLQVLQSLSLAAVPAASNYGQAVVFKATAQPENGAGVFPTGLVVDFVLDAGPNQITQTGVPVNTTTGEAFFDPQTLAGFTLSRSSHTVDATFRDTNSPAIYQGPVNASQFSYTVNKSDVGVGVSSSPLVTTSTPIYGQPTTVTATITPAPAPVTAYASNPTNTATFNLDGGGGLRTFTGPVTHSIQLVGFSNAQQFTLTYGGTAVGPITYSSTQATTAANIQTLLNTPAILGAGKSVAVNTTAAVDVFSLTFGGGLANTNGAYMTGAPVGAPAGRSVNANLLTASWTIPISVLDVSAGHALQVSYDGDTNYNQSPAPTNFTLPVFVDGSNVEFRFSPPGIYPPNHSELGQNASFYVVVSPQAAGSSGVPQGTVNFYDNLTTSPPLNASPVALVNGVATFQTAALAAGPHNIVAVFTPSNSNYTGNSKTTSFTVDPAQTTVTFDQVNPTTPTYGNSVAFTIKVTPQDPGFPTGTFGSPAGTVTLWKNAVGTSTSDPNYLGTGSLNAVTGKTTITTVPGALPQGDLTIIAHYVGSTSFAANDGTLSPLLHVNPATTNTGLSASPSSGAVYGQNVTLVATITSPAGTPPAGSTVTFWDGPVNTGINLGTRFTDSLGRATLVTNALSVGNHPQINAVFTDTVDTNFDTSTGTILNYSVGQAPTKIVMGATPSAGSNYGMQVTFTATVSADTPGSGLPTDGTVVFTDSVIGFLGNGTLGAGGVYSYQTTSTQLTVGFHTITASFSGDTNLQNKTGQLTNYNVQPAVTTVSLLQSSNLNAVYGEAVQFSATISAIGGAPAPTSGVVTFKNGATVLGTANLTGTNVAVYTIMTNPPQLAVGNGHQITATFGGFGPNYSASPQSAAISQNVAAADTDIPALTFTSSPINPGVGQTVTISAIVVALPNSVANVNAGTVTFVDTTTGLTLGGGPATVSVSGFASVTTTFATTGPHVITAKYNGFSPNFNASPTRTISSNVNVLRATSVNVSAVANTFGQNLVYTLTVTSPQGGVPTGTVTLKEGATTLGNVGTLANVGGVATTTITVPGGVLNAGPHTLTFTYHDTSVPPVYADGVTTLNPQTVAPSGTAITFTPAPQTTAIYGTTVTYAGVVRTTVNQSINLNGQTHNSTLIDGLSSTAQLGVGMSVTGTGIPANTAIASIGSPTSITLTTAATTTAATALTFGGINPTAGTVTLKDATTNTTLGTFNLSGSNAFNFPSVSLPLNVNAGAHSITATFTPGSANYNASPAARSPLTISAAQTQIAAAPISSVTSGPLGGSYFGQQVKFTATVTATNSPATPTGGTVSFFLNGSTTPMGTVALGAGGIAEFTTTPTGLPVNTTTGNKITARYNGSTNFQANTVVSPQRTQFVSKAETGVTITPTSASIVFGQSVTFTAVVSVSSPGSPGTVPTTGATVSFYNGASTTPITGTLTLVSATAPVTYRFTTSALPASATPHSITAKYSGVGNFAASPASNAASVTVAQSGSTVRLTASPTVLATDKINTFTVVVTRTTGSGTITAAPAMVTINDFGNPIGTATLVSSTTSTATYRYTAPANSLADGPHQITAVYSGNTNVAGNTSNLIPQVVHKFSSLALVASASPMATLPVTFTATLTGLNGVPIGPGAQVTFTINGQTFTATTNASGVAKVTYTFSTAGTYKITAVFATDGIYNGVTNTLTTIVQPKVSGRLV